MTPRRLIPLLLALAGMCCSAVGQTPTAPTSHKLVFRQLNAGDGVVALLDDHTFSTIAALKDHIATFPSGSEIRYWVSDQDSPGMRQFVFWGELPSYCREKGIKFVTIPVEL
jgi:hypothetical protein